MPQSTIEYTLYFTCSTQHSGYKVLCYYVHVLPFQILEVIRNPVDGVESTALTDTGGSREEEIRHRRLLEENEELKTQIQDVRSYLILTL